MKNVKKAFLASSVMISVLTAGSAGSIASACNSTETHIVRVVRCGPKCEARRTRARAMRVRSAHIKARPKFQRIKGFCGPKCQNRRVRIIQKYCGPKYQFRKDYFDLNNFHIIGI